MVPVCLLDLTKVKVTLNSLIRQSYHICFCPVLSNMNIVWISQEYSFWEFLTYRPLHNGYTLKLSEAAYGFHKSSVKRPRCQKLQAIDQMQLPAAG